MTALSIRCSIYRMTKVGFGRRTVYSGPDSFPVFSRTDFPEDNGTWEWKKMSNIRQRVLDIQNGVVHDGDSKIVDDEARKMYSLPHKVFTNPENHFQPTDIAKIVFGKELRPEQKTPVRHRMDPDFAKPGVQKLLKSVTGRNPEKLFAEQKTEYEHMPRVRLLTKEQLQEEFEKMNPKADALLEMPPVMLEREPIDETIACDELLDGYEESSIVFTDITEDVKQDDRLVVVREPNGLLRKANWPERDRILTVYYPVPGRNFHKDPVINDPKIAFQNRLHENILERILVEFEPDSPEFIKHTQRVYDDVEEKGEYELLRSTRFFGGFVLYLTKQKSIDGVLQNTLENFPISTAADLIRLYTIVHPDSKTATTLNEKQNADDTDFVEIYILENSTNKSSLTLALQSTQQPKTAATS